MLRVCEPGFQPSTGIVCVTIYRREADGGLQDALVSLAQVPSVNYT